MPSHRLYTCFLACKNVEKRIGSLEIENDESVEKEDDKDVTSYG